MIPSVENHQEVNALLLETINKLQGKVKKDGVWYKPIKICVKKDKIKCIRCRVDKPHKEMKWHKGVPYCKKCNKIYKERESYK